MSGTLSPHSIDDENASQVSYPSVRHAYLTSSPRNSMDGSSGRMKRSESMDDSCSSADSSVGTFISDYYDESNVDRYGFFLDEQRKRKLADSKQKRLLVDKEVQRSMKWIRMLKKLEPFPMPSWPKKNSKLTRRLFKGIPNCLRTKVWGIMFLAMESASSTPSPVPHSDDNATASSPSALFKELYSAHSSYESQIDVDIERTLRNHILFKIRFGSGQASLFRILVALANANPRVGYCQGMSSVAAFFLLYFDEETAFHHLMSLFRSQGLDQLYEAGFPKLFETFFIHEKLLLYYYPKIYRHLANLHISSSIYATKWYLTLFLGLPYQVSARIWDLFLFYGYEVLFHAAISLMHYFERELVSLDYDGTMELLSKCDDRAIDPDKYIHSLQRTWTNSLVDTKITVAKLRDMYHETMKTSPSAQPPSPSP